MNNPSSKAKKPTDTSDTSSTNSDSSSSGSSSSGSSGSSSTSSTASVRNQSLGGNVKKIESGNNRERPRGLPHSSAQSTTNKHEKAVIKKTDAPAKKNDSRADKNNHYSRTDNMEKDTKSTQRVYHGRSPKASERPRDDRGKPGSTHDSKSHTLTKRDGLETKNKSLPETIDKIPQLKNIDAKEGEQIKLKTSHSKSSTRTPSPKLKDESRKRGDANEKRHHSPGRGGYGSRSTKRRQHSGERKDVKSVGVGALVGGVPDVKPTKLHVGHLTRHVTTEHLKEIFGNYGQIKAIEMPPDRNHTNYSKGYAYVEFESHEEAEKAQKFMNSGQIDGQEITVAFVLTMTSINATPSNATSSRVPSGGGDGRGGHRHQHNSSNAPPAPLPRKEGYNDGSTRRRERKRSGDGSRRPKDDTLGDGDTHRRGDQNRSSNRQQHHHQPHPSSRSDLKTSSRSTRPAHRSDDKRGEHMRGGGRSNQDGRREEPRNKGDKPSLVVGKEDSEAKKILQSSNNNTAPSTAAPNQGGKVVVQHGAHKGLGNDGAKTNVGTTQPKTANARGAETGGGGKKGDSTSSSSSSDDDNSSDSSSSSDSDDASSSDAASAGTARKRPPPPATTTKPAPASVKK